MPFIMTILRVPSNATLGLARWIPCSGSWFCRGGSSAASSRKTTRKNAVSGPFRDGVFQAKLDRQLGESLTCAPEVGLPTQIVAAFVAGYQQASARFRDDSVTGSEAFRREVNDGAEALRLTTAFLPQGKAQRHSPALSCNQK
jgi:hypothetical protein